MTTPFLINYEPYAFPPGTTIINNINDMVQISTTLPETIEYAVGSLEDLSGDIIIKNLTRNAILEVTIKFNSSAFIINTPDTTTPIILTIAPTTQQELKVKLNKQALDSNARFIPIQGNIEFTAKNLVNGTTVFKNV